jgi:hypothetical protein
MPHAVAMALNKCKIVAFATICNVAKAKEFYGGTLGLTLLSEEPPFALVYDANGTMVRLGMGKESSAGRCRMRWPP